MNASLHILWVGFPPTKQREIASHLKKITTNFIHANSCLLADYRVQLRQKPWDLVLVEFDQPELDPSEMLGFRDQIRPEAAMIFLSEQATVNDAVDVMNMGAQGIVSPHEPDRLISVAKNMIVGGTRRAPRLGRQDAVQQKLTQEALLESEIRFRSVIDSVNAHFYVSLITADDVFVNQYISSNIERITGYPFDLFLEDWEFWLSLINPADLVVCDKQVERLMAGVDSVIEYRVRAADGRELWIQDNAHVISHEDGRRTVYATMVDITQFKQAEEELRQRDAQFQAFMRYLPGAVFIKDEAGQTIYSNDLYGQTVEKKYEGLSDNQTPDHVLTDLADVFTAENAHVFATGEVLETTHTFQYEGHKSHWFTIKFPIYFGDNRPSMMGTMSIDVTKERAIEDALRVSEQRYRQMFEMHGLPKYIVDPDTKGIVDVNLAACRFYGYTREVFLNLKIFDINVSPRALVQEQIAAIKAGDKRAGLFTHRKANGDICYVETFIGLVDINGKLCHYSVVTDITERLRAKDELQKAHDLLEQRVSERTVELERAKNQLEAIFNNASEGIVLLDATSRIQQANSTFNQLFGLEPDEYEGILLSSLIRPDHVVVLKTMIDTAVETNQTAYLVVEAKLRNSFFSAEMSIAPIIQLHEAGIHFVCTVQDVTERLKAEDALQKSEHLLRQMAANYPNSYMSLIERDYTISFSSGQEFQKQGLDPNQYVGMTLDQVFGEATEFVREKYEQTFEGEEQSFEMANGGQHHLYRAVPLHGDDGVVHRILVVVENTTERKKGEIALRESELRYRILAEHVTDMISRHDLEGRYIYATPSAYKLTGYTPEELLGRPVSDYVHSDDRALIWGGAHLVDSHETIFANAYRVRRKNGAYVWLESINRVVRDVETGEALEVISVSRDISGRKEAEMHLVSLSKRLQLATEAGDIGVWDWNLVDDFMIWDQRMVGMYGLDAGSFTNMIASWEKAVHPDDLLGLIDSLTAAIGENQPYDVEFRVQLPGQTPRYIKERAIIIRDESGQALRMIGANMDITEQKEAEQILLSALEKEKELGELKSRFVSMASHEFRTPLAAILAATETLSIYRNRMSDEQQMGRLDKIRQQVGYMQNMMDDVLQLARVQAGKLRFEPKRQDFDVLCREIIEEFDGREAAFRRLVYQCAEAPMMADFDARLIHRIINNLISNALKYSKSDEKVLISLSCDMENIVLAVEDKGIGIPAKDIERLGEPFHRAGNVGTISGTGLGLSIIKGAIELHSGTLTIESEEGCGSRFVVMIPIQVETL